jgi:hypothetical protein
MTRNSHEGWLRYCETHRLLLDGSGIPASLYRSETLLRELLYSGATSTRIAATSLQSMSSEQWVSFERFVDHFFNDFESFHSCEIFPAYRCEKQRRA